MLTHRTAAAVLVVAGSLTAQATTWTSFQDRRGHAMASTPAGGVLMFGGERVTQPGTRLADTHRLSSGNQSWSRVPNAPVGRSGHGMAGVMVGGLPKYYVFGGITTSGLPSADTWVSDGSSWDPRGQGGAVPTARSAHGMVAGLLGGPFAGNPRIWLFGGFDGTSELSDLWSYQPDVDQWNSLGSAAGQPVGTWPSARSAHCLAFQQGANPGDERVYLFGGRTGGAGFNNDLWRFNPNTSTWQLLAPSNPPPARRDAAMAYVPGQGGMVLFGGRSASSSALGDTWVYDPTTNAWTQRTPPLAPPGRSGHAVTVEVTGDKLILMGGVDISGQPAIGTWIWDSQASGSPPGAWIEQLPVPSARSGAALAFDSKPTRQKHVLFGGASSPSGTVLDETWELDGIDWARKTPSARPSARTDAGMVYHAARDRMVLFGGRNQAGVSLGDTWEWNGTTWTLPVLTGAPPFAGGIQPVYDTARSRVVMPVAGATAMETWVLSGSAWSQLALLVNPPVRTNYGAAYDTRTDRIVMFGGMSSNVRGSATYNNETWIFDGTSWVRRFPANSPSPRGWCKLSYDESRSRVVLFGGADATNVFEETWEWDGSNWIQESPAASPTNPSLSYAHASSYDKKRALTVTHGALGTWDYGPVAPADVTSYGAGCLTSANATLNLKQLGWSRLWMGERLELDIEGAPSASLGLMLWGLSGSEFVPSVPLPLDLRLIGFSTGPCFLSTSADITSEAVFPPTTRYMSFPMPVDTFLLGVEVYLQMAYFDAPANPSNPPAVTSNALRMKLGQKASLSAPTFEPSPALNMVRLGEGSFLMGSPVTPLNQTPYFNQANAQPVHQVSISQPFWIGKYEVTQAEFQSVTGYNPSYFQGASYPNSAQRPVEQASWSDAMLYCAALTEAEAAAGRIPPGYQYRLPTEAEWEYACRAGTGSEFHLGSSLLCADANFDVSRHSGTACPAGQTSTVGSFSANAWGLYDMHGNVREWCLDACDATFGPGYPSSAATDPYVSVGGYRIDRGGSWYDYSDNCRSAFRSRHEPGVRNYVIGFRLVLGPKIVFYPRADLGMVPVSSGAFSMGSTGTIGGAPYFTQAQSQPAHQVTITRPFWMGRHEVTQQQWVAVMGTSPSRFAGLQRPVEQVSWADAVAYCAALTASEAAAGRLPVGYQYRLPTEAEWEYCCRAGTTSPYASGATIACGNANFDFNYHTSSNCGVGQTTVVGSYSPNLFGLFDMQGNVFEWCLDSWDLSANYPPGPVSDPVVTTGSTKIIRGGSWFGYSYYCASSYRYGSAPGPFDSVGFRIVLGP